MFDFNQRSERLVTPGLTSGKDGGRLSGEVEGGKLSTMSQSPGVCGGLGFLGEGLRVLSELGVAGVRLEQHRHRG